MAFDGVGHDAPDFEAVFGCDEDGIKCFVAGYQPHGIGLEFDGFEGEFAVDAAHAHVTVMGLEAAIHDYEVAVIDSHVAHGFAVHTRVECGCGVAYKLVVKVEGVGQIVTGRRGESGLHAAFGQRQRHA